MIFAASTPCESRATPLTVEALRTLGDRLTAEGDDFGAYLSKLAYYNLIENDPAAKLAVGLELVDLCLSAQRFPEAQRLIRTIGSDFPNEPSTHARLTYQYGYSLVCSGDADQGDLYLRQLQQEPAFRDRVLFLRARNRLLDSDLGPAKDLLQQIDVERFPYRDSVRAVLRSMDRGPSFTRRSKVVAGGLSACVPGLGQVYTGHYFDAIQSVVFNAALGGAAALTWKYEVIDRPTGDKNVTGPILITAVWSAFYIANVWNAANSANRYNRYHEMRFYDGMLNKLEVFQTDRNFFLGLSVPLGDGAAH